MIELELIKKIIFKNDKNLETVLNTFQPTLKCGYSEKLNKKLSKLYNNKFSVTEFEEYLNTIKDSSLNSEFLSEVINYFEDN